MTAGHTQLQGGVRCGVAHAATDAPKPKSRNPTGSSHSHATGAPEAHKVRPCGWISSGIRRGDMSLRAFVLGLIALAAAAASPATHAQGPDRMKIVAAKEMMEVTGAAKQFDQMV